MLRYFFPHLRGASRYPVVFTKEHSARISESRVAAAFPAIYLIIKFLVSRSMRGTAARDACVRRA